MDSFALIRALRQQLHACPEISGAEVQTKAMLQAFLREHTSMELYPCGAGFYAAHREGTGTGIAFRGDYDALALPEGGAAHLCGHDGHAAALCGLALLLEGQTVGRDVFLLFQPAEETGEGAEPCCELFAKEAVAEIYGAHNLPGVPLGQVTTRPSTFACASRGVTLHFGGKPTHAAYPEHGISPANAVGELLCRLREIADPGRYSGMTLCTVIGGIMGEKAFGAAAEKAELWLTLRGEHDRDLRLLQDRLLQCAAQLAERDRLTFSAEEQDIFLSTENDPACAEKVLERCGGVLLEQPMRWSEDFGQYLHHCKGAFFGIGAGEAHPALHTAEYEYPDALLSMTAKAFFALL